MNEFLLMFSLMLHGVTFIVVIYLYRQLKDQPHVDELEKTVREVEDVFASYLLELKNENERLMNILKENGKNVKVETSEPPPLNKFAEPTKTKEKRENENKQIENSPVETGLGDSYQPENIPVDETVELTLESRVLHLYKNGKTIEEIAKQLNKGKTEIELIIKFHLKD